MALTIQGKIRFQCFLKDIRVVRKLSCSRYAYSTKSNNQNLPVLYHILNVWLYQTTSRLTTLWNRTTHVTANRVLSQRFASSISTYQSPLPFCKNPLASLTTWISTKHSELVTKKSWWTFCLCNALDIISLEAASWETLQLGHQTQTSGKSTDKMEHSMFPQMSLLDFLDSSSCTLSQSSDAKRYSALEFNGDRRKLYFLFW